jgi:carbon storage regulator
MLVLTRKVGERIHIGDDVIVTVVRIQGDKIRLGIEAPPRITVHREEIYDRLQNASPALEPSHPAQNVPAG